MPASALHVPRRGLVAVALVALALAAVLVAAPGADARASRALLVFMPAGGAGSAPVLDRLAARPELAIGLVSATQGKYSPEQALLDVTAGSRTSRSVYTPQEPPRIALAVGDDGRGVIEGWTKVVARADSALAEIEPGLLASRVPGGAAFAGVRGAANLEAVAAADRTGRVAAVSLGRAGDLAARAHRLLIHHRLVVVALPAGAEGGARSAPGARGAAGTGGAEGARGARSEDVLGELLRNRRRGDVLIVMQAPPRSSDPQLLPAGAALPDGRADGVLTSPTTRLRGVVAAIDVPVTILGALGVPVPDGVKGQPLRVEGERSAAALSELSARLGVISERRTPAIAALLLAWALLAGALRLLAGRAGTRAALRIGGLAMLWVAPVVLLTGRLAPPEAATEIAIVVAGSFALAALTDRFVRWPRAPLVPAVVALAAYATDLVFGSTLLIRSLLGVNPRAGSRFYGLGNELESTLVVLLIVALGAGLMRRADFESARAPFGAGPGRSRRAAAIVVIAGVVAAVFVGSGKLGADVGGVITLGGGIAVMAVLLLPGTPSRRTIALALAAPVLAVGGLALLDLATGGNGHFTRTVLQADSAAALQDVVERRYTLAFDVLISGAMPVIVVIALAAVACAVRLRERVYAPLRGSPAWRAALAGGLAASVVGALFNDSGPILFVFGVFVLACVTAYVRGDPQAAQAEEG